MVLLGGGGGTGAIGAFLVVIDSRRVQYYLRTKLAYETTSKDFKPGT